MTAPTPSPRDELLARAVTWFRDNGVGDTSLRTLAAGIGTSHRMLNYHFGSREGLLEAVVETVEAGERATLQALLATAREDGTGPYAAGQAFWQQLTADGITFVPLFFELSGLALQGQGWAAGLRQWLADGWTQPLTELWMELGYSRQDAAVRACLNLAVTRGLLFELVATGDRETVEAAMAAVGEAFAPRPAQV